MRIVFWQNMLAFLQEPHIAALARTEGVDVVWVVREELHEGRRTVSGYPEVAMDENVERVVAPDAGEIERLLAERPDDSVHIVGGLGRYPFADDVVSRAHRRGLRYGVLQENRPTDGMRATLRRLTFAWERLRFRRSLGFVLVMGFYGPHGGRRYYRGVGYPAGQLYPYGYFARRRPEPPARRADGPFRFVFVGECIDRKGGDLLVDALGRLADVPWTLDLVGDGERREAWEKQVAARGLADRVSFRGSMANADAMGVVGGSDLLVLPSRFDGWGFVVNEALARGVPVACSDRCGAADLLAEPYRGSTYPAHDVGALVRVLSQRLENGPPTAAERRRIWAWNENADGERAAEYLLACVRHAGGEGLRPAPPWRPHS